MLIMFVNSGVKATVISVLPEPRIRKQFVLSSHLCFSCVDLSTRGKTALQTQSDILIPVGLAFFIPSEDSLI